MLRPGISEETDQEDIAGPVGMMSVLEQPGGRSRVLTQPGGFEQCLIMFLFVDQRASSVLEPSVTHLFVARHDGRDDMIDLIESRER